MRTLYLVFIGVCLFASPAAANPLPYYPDAATVAKDASPTPAKDASPDVDSSKGNDSGCSLVGSRTVRDLGPWLLAGTFSLLFVIVRRRRSR